MKNNTIINAVIFDLSGTLVDYGSLATIITMRKTFQSKGIKITNEIIKKDMGIKKKIHIKRILNNPLVKSKWFEKYNSSIKKKEFENLCLEFDKLLPIIVKKNLNIIPNVKKIIKFLKKNNIKIGITTGYPKKITKIILNFLNSKKIFVDCCVCVDEVKNGRPKPDMCLKNLKQLKIYNPKKCIKVDDSISGITEGRKAKMITVGLVSTGIQMGLSKSEYKKMNKSKLKNKITKIKKEFKSFNADLVVNNLYDFERILKKKLITDSF